MENNVIEKAEYLKETKNLIRQALQKQGADVSDTDPFRAFASIISSLKTGSGDDAIKVKTGEEIDNMTLDDTLVCICSNDYSYTDSDGVLVKYERGVIYEIVNGSVSKLLFDTNTTNYRELSDKPSINGVELDRNKSLTELGIQPKGDYALKKDLPRNTSELNNDSGFLTSFTEEDPTVPDYVKAITAEDIEKWNNKSDFDGSYSSLTGTPIIPTKTSELTNDSSFVDESYVTGAIENAQQGYATIDDLNNKVDKVVGKSLISDSEIERLANITNYDDTEIKNILNNKADTSAIPTKVSQLANDAGYLTEHQDISNLATKDELHFHDNKGVLDNITQENIDNWNNGTGGSAYELPIASDTTLGGIKVGNSLDIDGNGVLDISGDIKDIVYSDDANETIVGYIIENNAKIPLYRKIFKGEKVADSNLVFDTTALDIDKVLNILGTTDRGTWIYPLMRYEASDNLTFAYYIPKENKLVFTSGTSSWSSTGKVTIILEYTKKNIDESSVNINRILCEKSAYSEEETVVGTWTDGKPLYRKSFTVKGITAVSYTHNLADLNMDMCLFDFSHSVFKQGVYSLPFGIYGSNTDYIRVFFQDNNSVVFQFGSVYTMSKDLYFTIEYTKTTD